MAFRSGAPDQGQGHAEEDEFDENGARIMTKRGAQRLCRERGTFLTPSCNSTLYLHGMQFRKVAGLEEFTACR